MPIDLAPIAIIAVVAVAAFLWGGPKVLEWARTAGKARRAYADALAGRDEGTPAKPEDASPSC